MQRVITYVDGFNLYFGLREKGWRKDKLRHNLLPETITTATGYTLTRPLPWR